MLTRQEVVLRIEDEACLLHLGDDLIGVEAELRWRSFGRVLSKIDNRDAA